MSPHLQSLLSDPYGALLAGLLTACTVSLILWPLRAAWRSWRRREPRLPEHKRPVENRTARYDKGRAPASGPRERPKAKPRKPPADFADITYKTVKLPKGLSPISELASFLETTGEAVRVGDKTLVNPTAWHNHVVARRSAGAEPPPSQIMDELCLFLTDHGARPWRNPGEWSRLYAKVGGKVHHWDDDFLERSSRAMGRDALFHEIVETAMRAAGPAPVTPPSTLSSAIHTTMALFRDYMENTHGIALLANPACPFVWEAPVVGNLSRLAEWTEDEVERECSGMSSASRHVMFRRLAQRALP